MVLKLTYVAGAVLAGAAVVCPMCLDASGGALTDAAAVITNGSGTAVDTARVKLRVKGMTCGSCATTARMALERSEGVHRADVSYDSASAVVVYDPKKTSPPKFIVALKKLTGYEATVVPDTSKEGVS